MSGNSRPPMKQINLAFQGGGSHGAFSWGVVDRILEDGRLKITAVTGASAGAMNAVALADGLADGCHDEARATLRRFWEGVAKAALASPFQRTPLDHFRGDWSMDTSPAYLWFDMLSRVASPYVFNPLNLNPLKELIERLIDFERVRRCTVQAHIAATNVQTGRAVVFEHCTLTCDHVMASACLPHIFQAVEIDGVPYWDGGYMGNPPLWPLFDHSETDDVVIVQINPLCERPVPVRARDIVDRIDEITFNASLLRELRAVDFVDRLLEDGRLEGTGYRRVLVHMIADEDTLSSLGASSKLNAESTFINMLFEKGRSAADRWLAANYDAIGKRSTIDLRRLFEGEEDALDGNRLDRGANYQRRAGSGGP